MAERLVDAMSETLLSAVLNAQSLEVRFDDPLVLRDAALEVARLAEADRCDFVVAASGSAQHLAGAVTALSGVPTVSVQRLQSARGCRVLVVDLSCVTGLLVREAVAAVRVAGADWVGVAVGSRIRPDLDGLDALGPDLAVFEFASILRGMRGDRDLRPSRPLVLR